MSDIQAASERFGVSTELLTRVSHEIKSLTGCEVLWDAEDRPSPHMFVMAFIDRVGRTTAPWLYIGVSMSSPWDLKDNGLISEPRFKSALKSYGRSSFLRLPVYMHSPAFNDSNLQNVLTMMLNTTTDSEARQLFNSTRHKEPPTVNEVHTASENTSAVMAENAPAPKEKKESKPREPKAAAPRAERKAKEDLSPRVVKWIDGRLKDLQSHAADLTSLPSTFSVAKRWVDIKKEHEDVNDAVAAMKSWLIERNLVSA